MVLYRRNRVAGGTYFLTLALQDRRRRLLIDHVAELRLAIASTRSERPFRLDAIVVLPEHLHLVCTLPADDFDYSSRVRQLKGAFTRSLRDKGIVRAPAARGEYRIWQPRFREHTIRDEDDLRRHIDYTHFNPLKHGLVREVRDWPFSSFHRYVRDGIIPSDWGGAVDCGAGGRFGE